MDQPYDYKLTFNGKTTTNPGAGYASYKIQTRTGKEKSEKRIALGSPLTNNQAEYLALLNGLQAILEPIKKAQEPTENYSVEIWGNSLLVINQLKGSWAVENEKLLHLHDQATKMIKRFKTVSLNWHAKNENVKILGH
jgi:ribonuclease HI